MKLLVLADIHGAKFSLRKLINLTSPDYIIIPGDLPSSIDFPTLILTYASGGNRSNYIKNAYTKFKIRLIDRQIKSAKRLILKLIEHEIPILLIHGNTEAQETRFWLDLFSHRYPQIHWISDGHVLFNKILFIGHGWVPIDKGDNRVSTPGEIHENIARKILLDTLGRAKQKADYTILVSHSPPYCTPLDYLPHKKKYAGSSPVREMLDSGYFDAVISGHLHESWGFYQSDKGWWGVNAGSVAEDMACLVDTKREKVKWYSNLVFKPQLTSLIYGNRHYFNYDKS